MCEHQHHAHDECTTHLNKRDVRLNQRLFLPVSAQNTVSTASTNASAHGRLCLATAHLSPVACVSNNVFTRMCTNALEVVISWVLQTARRTRREGVSDGSFKVSRRHARCFQSELRRVSTLMLVHNTQSLPLIGCMCIHWG